MDRTNGCEQNGTDDEDSSTNHNSIIKCENCPFWCSDARYIKLHREVDHRNKINGAEHDLGPLSHPAAKRFREDAEAFKASGELKKSNVEEMIKITHSLLSHLYSCLLDANGAEGTLTEAAQILERVVPQSTPSIPPIITNLPKISDQARFCYFLISIKEVVIYE